MLVISVIGEGFANQLYQYSTAYATAKRIGGELVIIALTAEVMSDPFQLSEFDIICSEFLVASSQIETEQYIKKINEEYKIYTLNEENYFEILNSETLVNYDGIYLEGHFQHVKYFENYIDELREQFRFECDSEFLQTFYQSVNGRKSVGVHICKEDHLYYEDLILDIDYYKAGMCYIEEQLGIGEAHYYIFTDDIEYARQQFGNNERIHYICNWGNFREAIEEFLALSRCQNHILTSASSFGRMAATLSIHQDGHRVFDNLGQAWRVDTNENTVYLDEDNIQQLARYYNSLFINGCNKLGEQDATFLQIGERIAKIEKQMKMGNYDIALGQVRKLWELTWGNADAYEKKMHYLYYESLYKCGQYWESLIESLYLSEDEKKYDIHSFDLEDIKKLYRVYDKKCQMIIIPSRLYNPMWHEEMIMFGQIMKRIGYEVTFMFWELMPDMEKYNTFNKKLYDMDEFVKTRGINTKCKQVDLNKKIIELGSLEEVILEISAGSDNSIFICKQKEVLEAIERVKRDNIVSVFWDYSNSLDAGNYRETGDRIESPYISDYDMIYCYNHSDYVVSYSLNISKNNNYINIEKGRIKELQSIAEFESISDEFVEQSIRIMDQIDFNHKKERDSVVYENKPLVSIIIPVFNRKDIIVETVDSALCQTYNNIEIIICDNKSNDGTYELLTEKYGSNKKIKIFRNITNLGPVYNWIECMKHTNGKYIKILWSDDLIDPSFIGKSLEVMEKNNDIAFCYTPSILFEAKAGRLDILHRFNNVKSGMYDKKLFYDGHLAYNSNLPVSPGCALFKKEDVQILENIPNTCGINCNSNGAGIDLLVYLLALNKRKYFYYINSPLAYFRYHNGSITVSNNLIREYNLAKIYFCAHTKDGQQYFDTMCNKITMNEKVTNLEEAKELINRYLALN